MGGGNREDQYFINGVGQAVMTQWDELYKNEHAQGFSSAATTDAAVLVQARSLLDQLLERGASSREAQQELQHLFERSAAT